MPIVPVTPSDEVVASLTRGMGEAVALSGAFERAGRRPPASAQIAVPHRGYAVPAGRLAGGRWRPARPACWLFLVRTSRRRPWQTATVLASARRPRFLSVTDGETGRFVDTLRAAERLPAVRYGRFEVRRLTCADAHLAAVWLRNLAAGPDLWFAEDASAAAPEAEEAVMTRWRVAACRHLLAVAEQAARKTPGRPAPGGDPHPINR